MTSMTWVFTLIVIFQVKHFLADFVFQNVYMLRKGTAGWGFVVPLATHSAIHAGLTLPIVLWADPSKWYLVVFDFVVHFITDRLKAGPRYFGRYDDLGSKSYWVLFGLDQMIHHLTHIYICWVLVNN